MLEAVRRHFGVPDRVLNVPVPEVVLQSPCVVAIVGELEPTGMAKHVRVDREWHLGKPRRCDLICPPVMSLRTLFLLAILSVATIAEPIDPEDIRVIDGDTIRVYHEPPDVRLLGFNAPETRRAACEAEAELGAKATRRLRDLVRAGYLDFEYIRGSCPEGTKGTPICNYRRDCGTLKSKGRDGRLAGDPRAQQ